MKFHILPFILPFLLFVGCNSISPSNSTSNDNLSSITDVGVSSPSGINSSSISVSSSSIISKGTLQLLYIPKDSIKVGDIYKVVPAFYILPEVVPVGAIRKTSWNSQYSMDSDTTRLYALNWNQALLICNTLSKLEKLDTVYSYSSIDQNTGFLNRLRMDPSKKGYRLPTLEEWALAQSKYPSQMIQKTLEQEWLLDSYEQNADFSTLFSFPVIWDSSGFFPKLMINPRTQQLYSAGSLSSLVDRGFRVLRRP